MTEETGGRSLPSASPGDKPDGGSKAEILNAIESLPEERRDELASIIISREFHSGPLPSPRTFAGYEVVLPGSAREILDMAVRQQKHDIAIDERALGSEIWYRVLTLFAATAVILSMIVGAVALAFHGHDSAAIALGAAGGAVLVAGAFLRGRDLFPHRQPEQKAEPAPAKKPQGRNAGRRGNRN